MLFRSNWTQPDNVFCSDHTEGLLVKCTTEPHLRGPRTDHVPILTMFEFPIHLVSLAPTFNFCMTNWKEFREELTSTLSDLPVPQSLTDEVSMTALVDSLTAALQEAIRAKVPLSKPSLHSKRWWTKELSVLKKKKKKLSNTSYKLCAIPDHPIHEEHWKVRNHYGNKIQAVKRAHWADFLEHMSNRDIWTVNYYISGDTNDGSKTRIPTLSFTPLVGSNAMAEEAASNEDKSAMLAKLMFPACPTNCATPSYYPYPAQLPTPVKISAIQIQCHIEGLCLHKAPGPDGIPNVVLKICADILTPYLVPISRAILQLKVYLAQWRGSVTCVLTKPASPDTTSPKPTNQSLSSTHWPNCYPPSWQRAFHTLQRTTS